MTKPHLKIGPFPIPFERENKNILLIGAPQQGKTVLINQALDTIVARDEPAIILVPKTTDFITTHWRKGDVVLCPLDKRMVPWSLHNDIKSVSDFAKIANMLHPKIDADKNAFFNDGARTIIEALLKIWFFSTDKSNKSLVALTKQNAKKWKAQFAEMPGLEEACNLLADTTNSATLNIIQTVINAVKPLALLENCDGDWSITKWFKELKGRVFLLSDVNIKDFVAPIYALFIDLFLTQLFALEQDRSRRIWLVTDELGNINKITQLPYALNVGASFGLCWIGGIQSVAQLILRYGETDFRNIINCAQILCLFNVRDPDTRDYCSRLIDKAEVESTKSNVSISAVNDGRDTVTNSTAEREKALVMPGDIGNLKPLHMYLSIANIGTTLTKLTRKNYETLTDAFVPDLRFSLDAMKANYEQSQAEKAGAGEAGIQATEQEQQKQITTPEADNTETNTDNTIIQTMLVNMDD